MKEFDWKKFWIYDLCTHLKVEDDEYIEGHWKYTREHKKNLSFLIETNYLICRNEKWYRTLYEVNQINIRIIKKNGNRIPTILGHKKSI